MSHKAKDRISKETPNLPSVEFISDIERVSFFVLGIKNVFLDLSPGASVFLESGAKLVRKDDITFRIYGYEEKSVESIEGVYLFKDLHESLTKLLDLDISDNWDYIDA